MGNKSKARQRKNKKTRKGKQFSTVISQQIKLTLFDSSLLPTKSPHLFSIQFPQNHRQSNRHPLIVHISVYFFFCQFRLSTILFETQICSCFNCVHKEKLQQKSLLSFGCFITKVHFLDHSTILQISSHSSKKEASISKCY